MNWMGMPGRFRCCGNAWKSNQEKVYCADSYWYMKNRKPPEMTGAALHDSAVAPGISRRFLPFIGQKDQIPEDPQIFS